MEAGLLSAVLGVVMVQTAGQILDLQKIAGFWREVGVASDQNLALKTPKKLEALFLNLNGEELTVKAAYNNSGNCETEKIVGLEIDVSGKFIFPGHREIHVVDTDYEQYAILRVSLVWRDKDFHVLKYFTRSLEDEYEPGFWRFREMTADIGLYLVARHGRCAKLLKEVSLRPGADLEEPLPQAQMLEPPYPPVPSALPGATCTRSNPSPVHSRRGPSIIRGIPVLSRAAQ
ncbi:epididymal-specific lipocalin-8 [Equus quagga]|uniref:epididymal-specific lipocalin-8 n=1 Tax=Equus quagga TaxID=89248 RepID=UPI001EE252B2|nr:epididymal-specific lipocalin-8 [Equus quagga]